MNIKIIKKKIEKQVLFNNLLILPYICLIYLTFQLKKKLIYFTAKYF